MQTTFESTEAMILHFGNRNGTYFAFALGSALVVFLGWLVAGQLRRRFPRVHPWQLAIPALLICLIPEALIYTSSRNGFYEVEQQGEQLRLHYLLPGKVEVLSLADVAKMQAEPDSGGGSRLLISGPNGELYKSSSAPQENVTAALEQLVVRWRIGS